MSLPSWQTTGGFLGTVTERSPTTLTLEAENASEFSIISGDLPTGLSISNSGIISGTPSSIGGSVQTQFVVRAANTSGVSDRTFILDIQGTDSLTWITPGTENTSTNGFIPAGRGGTYYIINKDLVDFQFEANQGEFEISLSTSSAVKSSRLYVSTLTNVDMGQPGVWRLVSGVGIQTGTTITSISQTFNSTYQGYSIGISLPTTSLVSGPITLYDPLPFGQKIIYYIEDQEGQLPPGLTLYKTGRLAGLVKDQLSVDLRISSGGYDADQFSAYPYDHGILVNGQYVRRISKFIPKIYQFTVTAYNGINTAKRSFKLLIVDPSNLVANNEYATVTGPLEVESSQLVTPVWLSPVWFGFTSTIGILY